jgi:hypothetical protein
MFKTPFICDRRVYSFKGKWRNPNEDIDDNIYYFVKDPLTMVASYVNGREELKATITITVFGSKPIVKEDSITLHTGATYKVQEIIPNYFEPNILVRDMLKPRIESFDLVLG